MTALIRFAPLLALAVVLPVGAADPAKTEPPKTLMVAPGKLLMSDDLNAPLGQDWKTAKGRWDVIDGTIRKGHVCRVLVRPTGLTVQKDAHDKDTEKPMQLDTAAVAIKPGKWHTLVVELRGPDILATLDGKHTVFGSHPGIDLAKTDLGLTVAGEFVSFKGLRVWESAGPQKDWDATKTKLLEAKKAKP